MTNEDFCFLVMEYVGDDSTRKKLYNAAFEGISSSALEKLKILLGDDDVFDEFLEENSGKDGEEDEEEYSDNGDF